mgnify:CR=1 FL=1
MIEAGQIVKNLIPTESVTITKVQPMGSMYSVFYMGINSNQPGDKVIDAQTFANLEVISTKDKFNFMGNPKHFALYAEAERISSAYQFDPLFAVNCSVVDPLPHQVEAVYKYLLPQPKIRFLLADDTGAGKTIMTGLLIKELLMRGLIERILVITPGGLTKQWQEDEMALKFNIPFKLVNRSAFVSDPTIFSTADRLITSIDFLRGEDVLNVVKETSWDLIVVDEAHKLSAFDYGQKKYVSKRYQALEALANKCEHLLLLTATPHRGRRDTFKNLLQLLDEDIFASDSLVTSRINEVSASGVNKFFIRRLKEDMKDWDGHALFKERRTYTTLYTLTPEEKKLYDKVTEYLTSKRKEAQNQSNIHVSLALMVMQRRLTSSIKAIMKTLQKRYRALKELEEELRKNPGLFQQRVKLENDFREFDDYDEFDDDEKESLENIFSDPKKAKLFTTAKSGSEIKSEAAQVKALVELAENLYNSQQEEAKLKELHQLLTKHGVLDDKEKLVIFTEHKDTLDYLADKLYHYEVVTIHGGKSVDERRQAQSAFAKDARILIATDAAGEGINLQFCRLLINWDIPWNPNRLEQRMGRIHRYGQKDDVKVFNLVAKNTREGNVLQRLLDKLNLIREQIGNDRVYDVISDIFEGVSMDDIINTTFEGSKTDYDDAIAHKLTEENVQNKIDEQKDKLAHSQVDYSKARELNDVSREKRLQPIYVEKFFKDAFAELGGRYTEVKQDVFRVDYIPDAVRQVLKEDYNMVADIQQINFCFNKEAFKNHRQMSGLGTVHYINPGNALFDSLIKVVQHQYKEDMLQGTIMVSAEDTREHFAFFVKSQIGDNRPHREGNTSIADERLMIVQGGLGQELRITSAAKFIDLKPPATFAKKISPPPMLANTEVIGWSFENITVPQFEDTKAHVQADAQQREAYLDKSFSNIMMDIQDEINALQGKQLLGDQRAADKIAKKQVQIDELKRKKENRLRKLQQMQQLDMKTPQVLGCAYVVPLTQLEYKTHFGMQRDDEVEAIAMEQAMAYEHQHGRTPEDVSADNVGYDIKSVDAHLFRRYIEVKGRSANGHIMLSENEMNQLKQLGKEAWLYIVTHCKTKPQLHCFNDPGNTFNFEKKTKGVQYLLTEQEWKSKIK